SEGSPGSSLYEVKRPRLGLTALAVVAVVIFAPRPSANDSLTGSRSPASPLIGRILAPAFNAGELREQRYEDSIKDPGLVLWVVYAAGLVLAVRRRSFFVLVDRLQRSGSHTAFSFRASRAPPFLVLI
ncbi:MAG: hypothetical protein M3P18_12035, partial [Actinomycetota bacterium]|nr:hypothetical protein [Actinomycetota bacterium]